MPLKSKRPLFCTKMTWRERSALCLGNQLVRLVALTGGGHVAEFRFETGSGLPALSPLWTPPWRTIEPYLYREETHASCYGTITEGKLLSGIVGHNICLDYFGSPSPEEAAAGLSQHGEAPSSKWRKTKIETEENKVLLGMGVRLPMAGLSFEREITLRAGESVAYFQETVRNDRSYDHFFQWTQHVTLGPPFAHEKESYVVLPATKGLTFPHGYDEGKALLQSGKEFRWPQAPAASGGKVDLSRTFIKRGLGFVAAVLFDPDRDNVFIAAVNRQRQLLFGYCFRRQDFPWACVWEENRAISARPWNGQTQARGLEFTTNPIPVPRRESFALGKLFGTPTLSYIPAGGQKTVRYAAFLAPIPPDFDEVRDIQVGGAAIHVMGTKGKTVVVPATGLDGAA